MKCRRLNKNSSHTNDAGHHDTHLGWVHRACGALVCCGGTGSGFGLGLCGFDFGGAARVLEEWSCCVCVSTEKDLRGLVSRESKCRKDGDE